jgi:cellulose synthase/poly-beta-1,6-N-acetylglucosamine synthase-like glycosyltransferase
MMSIQPIVAIAAVGLAALALFGSLYVLFFALLGERTQPRQNGEANASEPRTRFLVLVPAHNEEEGIRPTMRSLRALDYPSGLIHVIVIADNCDDNTADVVRQEGFECWVRQAPEARGKGQALGWALDGARDINFDAVGFIDADSTLDRQFFRVFDHEFARGAQALQARYDFESGDPQDFSLFTRASKRAETELIWAPRQKLGLVVFLQGNGFCLRRDVFSAVPWTAHSITEDVEFSLELALRGIRVDFLESTSLASRLTGSADTAFPQRLRWASGTLQVTLRYLPRLLTAALKQRSWRLAEAAIALLLSSRPVLAYLSLLALGASFLGLTPHVALGVRIAVGVAIGLQLAYLVCVMRTVVKDSKSWLSLLSLPVYMGWLLFVHILAALGVRRKVWARTAR